MMEKLMRLLFNFKDIKFKVDDDFIDRMTRRYTTLFLVLFSIVVTTKIYVGDPIYCWCPATFTDSHKHYAYTMCWVKNTYYVPMEDKLPDNHEPKKMISYYQWVPLILICQCLLCYLPSVIWRFMCKRSGLNVTAIMDAAIAGQRTSYSDIHDKTVRYIVVTMDKYLTARHLQKNASRWARFKMRCAKVCCIMCGRIYGNYLMLSYLFCKLCYIANAVGQLYVLDLFMGSGFHVYGIEVFHRFMIEDDWTTSRRFPRVTMCDFQIRHMNQVHRYVLQCVLPINLFNEKIFIFVWFWFAFLAAITILGFLNWAWKSIYAPYNHSYVKEQLLGLSDSYTHKDSELLKDFIAGYLKRDGMFIVRLLSYNVGSIVSAEVLAGLWEKYSEERREQIIINKPRINNRRVDGHIQMRRGTIEDV